MKNKSSYVTLSLFVMLSLLTSCMSTKKVTYFENKDEINTALSKTLYDAKIMPKDILQIQVFTMTPEAAAPFNLLKLSGFSSSTTNTRFAIFILPYDVKISESIFTCQMLIYFDIVPDLLICSFFNSRNKHQIFRFCKFTVTISVIDDCLRLCFPDSGNFTKFTDIGGV